MSTPTISPFSAGISVPASSNPDSPSGAATVPYVSPFAAPVPKEVDPDQFGAANAPDPAKERPLTGRSGADEGSDIPKTEKEASESEIRPFSEGFENFETRPDPIESSKYTPAEKEKLAKVAGRVPPWWPKDPDKGSYFYGAVQAIKKTGCSAEEVHLAVEKDYTSKELTLKEKTILSAGWPGVMPYYVKKEKYPEPSRKKYPEPAEKDLLSEFKRNFWIAMLPGKHSPHIVTVAERQLLDIIALPDVPKQIAEIAADVKLALIPLKTATPEEQDASHAAAERIYDIIEKWREEVSLNAAAARKYPYPYRDYPYPYRYPRPVRGARYPEPETGRLGLGRMRRFSETILFWDGPATKNPVYVRAHKLTGASAKEITDALNLAMSRKSYMLTPRQKSICQAARPDTYGKPRTPFPTRIGKRDKLLKPSKNELESVLREDSSFRENAEALAEALKISLQKAAVHEYEAQFGDPRNIPDNVWKAMTRIEEEKEWGGQPRFEETISGQISRFSKRMEGGVEKFEKTAEEFLKEIAEKWRRAKDYSPEEMIRLAQIKGAIPPWWPQKPDKTSYFYGHVQAIKKTGCSAEDVRLALEHDLRDEPLTDKEKVILKAGWPEVEPYFIRRAKYPELAFKKLPKPKYLELDDPDMERLLETLPLDIEKKSILEQRWIESFWHSVGKPIRTPGIPLTEREVKALKQDLEKYPESSERWHQIKYQLEHPTEMFPIELKSELNYETKRLSGKVEGFVRAGIIPTRKGKEGFSDEEIEDFEKARADEEEKLITLRTPLKIIADLAEELGMRASDLREKLFRCTQSEKKVFTPTQQRKVQKYFPKHFGMVGKKFQFRGEFEETIRPQSFSENINTDLKTDSFAALSPGEKLVIDLMKVVELGKVAEDPAYQRAIKATGVKVGGYSRVLRVFDKLERMKAITKTDQKILQAGWSKLFGKAGAKFVYPTKYFGLRVKTGIAQDAARLLASKAGKKIAAKTVAKLALRFVPYIGWGMLAIDIAESKPVQKLWDKYVKDPGSFEENPETLKNGLKSFSENISRPATFQEPVFAYWRDKIAERTRTDARRVNLILDRVKSRLGYNEARVGILLQRAERRPELLTARELSVLLEILPEKAIEDLQEYGKLKDAATRLSMPVRMVRSLISRAKREPRRIMVVEKNVLRDLWPKDFPEPMFVPR